DDVPHRADARAFDLLLEQSAGPGRLRRVAEVLVLVGGEVAAGVAEAAAQRHVHRVLPGRPVEPRRHRRPPVDDHGVAVRVLHVAAPDVEPLAPGPFRALGARGVRVVEPAEEQRGVAEVGQRLDAVLDLAFQDGGVDPVGGDVADVERFDVLAHRAQRGAGRGEVGAFAGEGVVGGRRRADGTVYGLVYGRGRGQGGASG